MDQNILLETGAGAIGLQLTVEAVKAAGLPSRFAPVAVIVLGGFLAWAIATVHGLTLEWAIYVAVTIIGGTTWGYETSKNLRKAYSDKE